ncbi:MAG TPA: NAD(P)/FAD-dependent oxidoreductase, partial [Gemmatimonadales bacterium]|nr:NAD(P)/FAD-dependent oxidoreductase [Gemmatimonadales bacterium]
AALARRLDRPNATLRLGAVVREVRWERGRVEVEYRDAAGATGRAAAPRAVITLPLGVLQRPPGETGTVRFDPPLEAKREPLARLDMGTVVRLVLHFERIWWDERLSFLHVPESEGFPIWWTPAPLEAPYLTGWAGGPRAERLAALGEEALVQRAVTELAHALGERASRVEALLLEAFHHDWSADPFARGAYSYAVVGGSDAPDLLAEPIEETLFFAGEATAGDGTNGTVQGALTTGTRAANRLLGAGGNR